MLFLPIRLQSNYWHEQQCFCFFLFPDQEKADLKADDTGEVGEGQETARAKEVWQKGWCLFYTVTMFIGKKQQIQSRTMLSTSHHPGASVVMGSLLKNNLSTCRIIGANLCELDAYLYTVDH